MHGNGGFQMNRERKNGPLATSKQYISPAHFFHIAHNKHTHCIYWGSTACPIAVARQRDKKGLNPPAMQILKGNVVLMYS